MLAFGHAIGHRLFTKHVLAGTGSAYGEFRMHVVGQDDVDHLHVRVVDYAFEVLVVVDRPSRIALPASAPWRDRR